MKKINKTKNKEGGFTLVELMVSTTIFVVIIISSIGSLLVLLGASKESRGLRFAMDNVNFAMESMTRSVRMGVSYYCSADPTVSPPTDPETFKDCLGGGTLLSFIPQANMASPRLTYKLKSRYPNDPDSTRTIERCEGEDCVEIVSSDIDVKTFRIYVTGSDPRDEYQAKAYILLKGEIEVKNEKVPFMIQALASQRNY
jgi:type II secretory pathway pseudopilin PulG